MRAVDTKVLVRLVVGADTSQTAIAERFVMGGVWISLPVLLEMTWTLNTVYGRSEAEIAAVLNMLLNHPSVSLQCGDAVSEAASAFVLKPGLGFADCLILALARSEGLLLGTFDRQLGKLEGAETLR